MSAEQLAAAGFKRMFRIVRCGPLASDDDPTVWRDPVDGAVLTEAQASKRLAERQAKKKEAR